MVGETREGRSRKELKERKIRLRFGRAGLNYTFYMIQKINIGNCEHCGKNESIENAIM